MKITVTGWNSIEELVKIKKINFSKVNILYSKLNRGENFFRMKKIVMRLSLCLESILSRVRRVRFILEISLSRLKNVESRRGKEERY